MPRAALLWPANSGCTDIPSIWRTKLAGSQQSEGMITWWLGFRQIKVKTPEGIKYSPGNAVVCGPYQSEADAQRERMQRLTKEWDAT